MSKEKKCLVKLLCRVEQRKYRLCLPVSSIFTLTPVPDGVKRRSVGKAAPRWSKQSFWLEKNLWLPVSSIFTRTVGADASWTATGRSVFQAFYLPSRVMCLCLGGLCFPCDLFSWLCLSLNLRMLESLFVVWWPQCHCSVEKISVLVWGFWLCASRRFALLFEPRRDTWLILPVVICLSQRLSHACLSTSQSKVKPRMAH